MTDQAGVRINKYISDAGICSRREADRRILEGRCEIERGGMRSTAQPGERVFPEDIVYVDGNAVSRKTGFLYILYNKPRGVVCTSLRSDPDNIIDASGCPEYVSYVGRLDKESTGLILLTNDGELNNTLARAANYHEKEYICETGSDITPDFLKKMSEGVRILDTVTRPCTVKRLGKRTFSIILTQGLNRQIRRMCGALGFSVVSLKRVRIQNLTIDGLKEGTWRYLGEEEIQTLKASLNITQ